MAGDYARWLENETAAALKHDTPADPFACIPDPSAEYEGTVLELREPDTARDIGAQRASELLAKSGDENWLGI